MKDNHTVKVKFNTLVWPILTVVLVLLQLTLPYRGWLILLLGLGGAWIISSLWVYWLAHGLRIKHEMRFGWAQVGDILEERFILVNKARIPAVWVEVTDHSTIPDRQTRLATGVGRQAENSWIIHQACTRRGLYTLGPITLTTSDPFGIYRLVINDNSSTSLLVTPPVLPLPGIQVTGGSRAGEGLPSRRAMEQSLRTTGVRDYVPGDNIRWIHWPTTARRDQLYVRTFDNTPVSDWWIVLDMDESVQAGQGESTTAETSVILAASLASEGLQSGLAVGLASNSEQAVWMPPKLGAAQNLAILRQLAGVSTGSQTLDAFLNSAHSLFGNFQSVVIITPAIQGRWIDPVLHLVRRGIAPTVILLDPQSFGGSENANRLVPVLQNLGITSYVVTPTFLEGARLLKHQTNAWEWRILGTGRVISVHKPGDLNWRALV